MVWQHKKYRVIAALAASLFFTAWLDPYQDEVSAGNSRFHEKKYAEAKNHYNNAEQYAPSEQDKDKLSFNKADADYMMEDNDGALASFQKAVQSGDKEVQKKAFFNMGNAYLKQKKYREAVNSYINALKIDPNYENAKKNIEYLLKNRKNEDKDKKQQGDKGKEGDDKKDKGGDNKDRNQGRKQGSSDQMSREQIKNILKSLKNKPVDRKKGRSDEKRVLEKNW